MRLYQLKHPSISWWWSFLSRLNRVRIKKVALENSKAYKFYLSSQVQFIILSQSNVSLKGDCKRRNCVYSQKAIIFLLWPTIQSISNQRTTLTSKSSQFKLNQVSGDNHSKIVIRRKRNHKNWIQVLTISSMQLEDLGHVVHVRTSCTIHSSHFLLIVFYKLSHYGL